jgi:hypothetical protein
MVAASHGRSVPTASRGVEEGLGIRTHTVLRWGEVLVADFEMALQIGVIPRRRQ